MSHKDTAPETQGVTVEILSIVDLGPEIAGMDGRQLRMRRVTLAPVRSLVRARSYRSPRYRFYP